MAWCRQETGHYLSRCSPRSISPCDINRPRWVDDVYDPIEQYAITIPRNILQFLKPPLSYCSFVRGDELFQVWEWCWICKRTGVPTVLYQVIYLFPCLLRHFILIIADICVIVFEKSQPIYITCTWPLLHLCRLSTFQIYCVWHVSIRSVKSLFIEISFINADHIYDGIILLEKAAYRLRNNQVPMRYSLNECLLFIKLFISRYGMKSWHST